MVFGGPPFAYRGLFIPPGGGFLARPMALVAASSGDLYVASWGSGEVRRYASNGSLIGIHVPRGAGGLRRPTGMAFGTDGNLYVVNDNSRVLRFDAATGS